MENLKKVYLIIGKARNGKDTVASNAMEILAKQGIKSKHMSFAKLLKEQAKELGWNGEKDDAGRTLLQHLGDVMKEYHGKSYYARYVLGQILSDLDNSVYFITDCRFKTELELFKTCPAIDATTIRVVRPNFISDLSEEQQHHISEIDLDDAVEDVLIENDSTEKKLIKKVENIFKSEA